MNNSSIKLTMENKNIIFWGTPEFALPSLEILHKKGLVKAVITQSDKAAGRGKKIISSPVKVFASHNNLPVLEPDFFVGEFIDDLKKYLPASFVIVAYGKIIPHNILELSDLPAINIHPSKLPILRGPSPIQTALLKGMKNTAVTLMQVDEKMDHGAILAQKDLAIDADDNYLSLSKKLAQVGAQMLDENITNYLQNKIKAVSQDDSRATFCKMIKKEDGLIDWNFSAEEINNKIKAFNPWPSAFFDLNGLGIKIFKAKVVDANLKPGEIKTEDKQLIIGTAKKSLQILQLQPAGKKIMSAEEFIRGYKAYLA